jgi:propionyl-CoA carboxylase alpha chain
VTFGAAGAVFVQDSRGELRLQEMPRFPEPESPEVSAGGYTAPMPGKVIEMRVSAGQTVSKGELLLTLEAMKMEHPVIASGDGVITEVRVAPGEQVAAGQVLLLIEASEEARAHGG